MDLGYTALSSTATVATATNEWCVDRLVFLEQKFGHRTTYELLEPFPLFAEDCIDVQRAAHRMASFVGLGEITFAVALVKQEDGVGGHVELNADSSMVFVEVAAEFAKQPAGVLAILAHEIAHKFLHLNPN